MYDVFISYSTRGAVTEDWVIKFVNDLEKYYRLNYSKDLSVWYALDDNEVGDNFRNKINDALKSSKVFVMILDPEYIKSPQTLYEVNEYERLRKETKEPEHFIKVIKWRGNKEEELINFIDSEIVVTFFSTINKDDNEEDCSNTEYINEIQNIIKAVKKRQVEQSRKTNAQKILQKLKELDETPKIFVALGYTGSKDTRSVFINQLSKTINRSTDLRNVKIFPDDFTVSLLTYEDLAELFYENNPYGQQCLDALLAVSSAAILLLISDKIKEAEDLLRKVQFQLSAIKTAAQIKKMPLNIFSDIPKEIYELSSFKEQIDNPVYAAYDNIKLCRGVDINTFIQSYLTDLESILGKKPAPAVLAEKKSIYHIYLIEHYSPENNAVAIEEAIKLKIKSEKDHRRELKRYLVDKKFVLIPALGNNANLKQAIEFHKSCLNLSDGIIIYRGVQEDYSWCIQQQTDTYNIILDLNEEKKKIIEKAVYVDPLQEVREPEEYFYFNYDVILNYPKDLDAFIWKIQQH